MRNIIFYGSYYEAIKELSDKAQEKTYKAIMDYVYLNKEPNLSGASKSIFVLIKPSLDTSIRNYENGKKGGRPKVKYNHNVSEELTDSKSEINTEIITEQKSIKDKDNNKKEDTLKSIEEKRTNLISSHTSKSAYGTYKNVFLTDEEYQELINLPEGENAINYFSEYREMKGYKCQKDYLAIKRWAFKAVQERHNEVKIKNNCLKKMKSARTYTEEETNNLFADIKNVQL